MKTLSESLGLNMIDSKTKLQYPIENRATSSTLTGMIPGARGKFELAQFELNK